MKSYATGDSSSNVQNDHERKPSKANMITHDMTEYIQVKKSVSGGRLGKEAQTSEETKEHHQK